MADRQEQLQQITEKLEQGVQELCHSNRFKNYLNVMSRFPSYSARNSLLIAMQCPDATLIAGYRAWEKDFERHVRKGEQGIRIIAPVTYRVEKEVKKIDPVTHQPMLDAKGQPVMERVQKDLPSYRVISVFDISQTEGKELPEIAKELRGKVPEFKDFFAALRSAAPVSIQFETLKGSMKGYYDNSEKKIVIKKGMSQQQTLKSAVHEIAHGKLHDSDFGLEKDADRRTKEVQAEAIAYTVCKHYGIDTSDYSFGYIAGWSSDVELEELHHSLDTIRKVSSDIILQVDTKLKELQPERELVHHHGH